MVWIQIRTDRTSESHLFANIISRKQKLPLLRKRLNGNFTKYQVELFLKVCLIYFKHNLTIYKKTLTVSMLVFKILTHISLASILWDMVNSADPDQTKQNAASDKGLHCLLTEYSNKI